MINSSKGGRKSFIMKLIGGFLTFASGKVLAEGSSKTTKLKQSSSSRNTKFEIMRDVLEDCSRNEWDTTSCAEEMANQLYASFGIKYNCLTTNKYEQETDVFSISYGFVNHPFDFTANCGKRSSSIIDRFQFESQCDSCSNLCDFDPRLPRCVAYCLHDRYGNDASFLVARQGEVGGSTYGGHIYESRYGDITCGGYYDVYDDN